MLEQRLSYLLCQTLLHLQPPGKYLRDACEFRKTNDAPMFRDISDVAFADERSEVMFTHRCDRDVFYKNHLVVRITGQRLDVRLRIDPHPFGKLGIKVRDTLRSLLQTVTFRILTDTFEDQPHAGRDLLTIDLLFSRCHFPVNLPPHAWRSFYRTQLLPRS